MSYEALNDQKYYAFVFDFNFYEIQHSFRITANAWEILDINRKKKNCELFAFQILIAVDGIQLLLDLT